MLCSEWGLHCWMCSWTLGMHYCTCYLLLIHQYQQREMIPAETWWVWQMYPSSLNVYNHEATAKINKKSLKNMHINQCWYSSHRRHYYQHVICTKNVSDEQKSVQKKVHVQYMYDHICVVCVMISHFQRIFSIAWSTVHRSSSCPVLRYPTCAVWMIWSYQLAHYPTRNVYMHVHRIINVYTLCNSITCTVHVINILKKEDVIQYTLTVHKCNCHIINIVIQCTKFTHYNYHMHAHFNVLYGTVTL